MIELATGITVDPNVRFGKPVILGTRVPVDKVCRGTGMGDKLELRFLIRGLSPR
jgi:uncharacterized protein (DUF433 family)